MYKAEEPFLFFIVPALTEEEPLARACLKHARRCAHRAGLERFSFHLILQGEQPPRRADEEITPAAHGPRPTARSDRPRLPSCLVEHVPWRSASRARNRGLRRVEEGAPGAGTSSPGWPPRHTVGPDHERERAGPHGYVMFLDVRVRPSAAFFRFARALMQRGDPIGAGAIRWTEPAGSEEPAPETDPPLARPLPPARLSPRTAPRQARPPRARWLPRIVASGFLWHLLLRADSIAGLRFPEEIGPGEGNRLVAGEDCLFLLSVLERVGTVRVTYDPGALVHHLPRTCPREKAAAYARGQGYALGALVRARLPWPARAYFAARMALFLGNGARHALFGGRRGRSILRERWRGVGNPLSRAT